MSKEIEQKKPVTMEEYVKYLNDDVMKGLAERRNVGFMVPKNYAPSNALASALFTLTETVDRNGNPALRVCTPTSVKQALTEMITKGLNPSKKQCYFIVYGDKLTCFESYFGLQHRAKQADPNIVDIFAEIVFEKDKFAYSLRRGAKVITQHEQLPENLDVTKIKGAYATIVYKDDKEVSEYMSWDQIQKAWSKSPAKGKSDTHVKFADEMAKRTVLNRLVKNVVNTSDDSQLIADAEDIADEQEQIEATEVIDITPYEEEPSGSSQEPAGHEEVVEEEQQEQEQEEQDEGWNNMPTPEDVFPEI